MQPSAFVFSVNASRVQLSLPAFAPERTLRILPTMSTMLRILTIAALVAATFAALAEFKTCDANTQSVTAFTQATISAQADFEVYSSALIDAKAVISAAQESGSIVIADGIGAVVAQAGQGKCVDVEITNEAFVVAETISTVSAAISAVVKAEADAFAGAYLSLSAYSQAAAESCSCPANSDAIDSSLTIASSDLFVEVSSEAQEYFNTTVVVAEATKAWGSVLTDCTATPRLCHRRNRFTSSVGGSCSITVIGSR